MPFLAHILLKNIRGNYWRNGTRMNCRICLMAILLRQIT